MRPVPTDFANYRRLRRRALWATLTFGVPVGWLVHVSARAMTNSDPLGMIPAVMLCIVSAWAWFVLRRLWRTTLAARPVVQSLSPTQGEIFGVPELDVEARRHRGLSDEITPPRRW